MEPPAKNPSVSLGKPIDAKNIPISNPLGVQSVYANDFGYGFTLTDVRLIFNEIGADAASNAPSKVLKANIVLPVQGAEFFAKALTAAIEEYKKNIQALQTAAAHAQKPIS